MKKFRQWFNSVAITIMSRIICLLMDCDGMCGRNEACGYCKAYDPHKTNCDIPD